MDAKINSSCGKYTFLLLAHLQWDEGGDRPVAGQLGQRGVITVTQSQELLVWEVEHQKQDEQRPHQTGHGLYMHVSIHACVFLLMTTRLLHSQSLLRSLFFLKKAVEWRLGAMLTNTVDSLYFGYPWAKYMHWLLLRGPSL